MRKYTHDPDIDETEHRPHPGCAPKGAAPAWTLRDYICPGYILSSLCMVMKRYYSKSADAGFMRRMVESAERYIKELIVVNNFNVNLQIYSYVRGSKEGQAWARKLLGERRIKEWQWRYYMLITWHVPYTKPKPVIPGLTRKVGKLGCQGLHDLPAQGRNDNECGGFANDNVPFKLYWWKPIRLKRLALPKGHVARATQNPSTKGSAPRGKRGFKPAVFTPEELGVTPTPALHEKRVAAERLLRHQARHPARAKPPPVPGFSPGSHESRGAKISRDPGINPGTGGKRSRSRSPPIQPKLKPP